MVKEYRDITTNILDFNLESHKSNTQEIAQGKQQLKHRKTASVDDLSPEFLNQLSSEYRDQLNTNSKNNRADYLSWNFFQEISDLDNQLRSNTTSDLRTNADNLMTRTPTNLTSNDRENFSIAAFIPNIECQDQSTASSRVSKTNGFALAAASIDIVCDDIYSQPDVIFETHQLQQEQQPQNNIFQFTSPTSTFKRRKLLQQQRELNEGNALNGNLTNKINKYNKNNNNYNNNKNNNHKSEEEIEIDKSNTIYQNSLSPILNSNTVTIFANKLKQQPTTQAAVKYDKQKQSHNEGATTMISDSSGVIIDQADKIALTTRTSKRGNTINGRKLSATIGRLPDNGSTITTSDDTKPVSGNQGTTRRQNNSYNNNNNNNSRRSRMGTSLPGSHSESSKASVSAGHMETHMSLFGWRKKCLYGILVLLMLLITTNLMLTFWILQVMEFSTEGMGLLKIVPGGIQLTGQALVMDMLRASTIRSRSGQPIAIESSRNFSINTRDSNGMLENHLFLGHDKLECLASGFSINDTAGRNLFSVNRNEVTIGAHALKIDGEGGAVFRESVQTPHIRAEPGRELRLESPTRQLEMTAAKDINLQSRAGGIELSALEDIKISALDGSLRLDSSKILMPNLRTAQSPLPGSVSAQNREHLHRVFQLCACANGKIFLAAPHSICAGDDSTVCR